jgi:hypothetical protein
MVPPSLKTSLAIGQCAARDKAGWAGLLKRAERRLDCIGLLPAPLWLLPIGVTNLRLADRERSFVLKAIRLGLRDWPPEA